MARPIHTRCRGTTSQQWYDAAVQTFVPPTDSVHHGARHRVCQRYGFGGADGVPRRLENQRIDGGEEIGTFAQYLQVRIAEKDGGGELRCGISRTQGKAQSNTSLLEGRDDADFEGG